MWFDMAVSCIVLSIGDPLGCHGAILPFAQLRNEWVKTTIGLPSSVSATAVNIIRSSLA